MSLVFLSSGTAHLSLPLRCSPLCWVTLLHLLSSRPHLVMDFQRLLQANLVIPFPLTQCPVSLLKNLSHPTLNIIGKVHYHVLFCSWGHLYFKSAAWGHVMMVGSQLHGIRIKKDVQPHNPIFQGNIPWIVSLKHLSLGLKEVESLCLPLLWGQGEEIS